MKTVTIDHKRYKVLDNLGFQHGRGSCWAVEVETPAGPRIATRDSFVGSQWVWASPATVLPRLPITGQ